MTEASEKEIPLIDAGLAEATEIYGVHKYMPCLMVLWTIRLFDFLEYSMVIPSLQGFILLLGGHSNRYYYSNLAFTAVLMVCRSIVARYIDRTKKLTVMYDFLLPIAIASNLFYAGCPVWGIASLLIVARAVSGAGAASESLIFFYLNLAAKPKEMQEWTTFIAATRSIGYTIGPVLGSLLTAAGAGLTGVNDERSTWGPFGLVGWFLGVANLILWIALKIMWIEPPAKPMSKKQMTLMNLKAHHIDLPTDMRVRDFVRHWAVIAVFMGNFSGTFIGLGLESIVPPTTTAILDWGEDHSANNGLVFAAIGFVLILGQLTVMAFNRIFYDRLSSGAVFLTGLGGMSFGMILVTFCWSTITPGQYHDPLGRDFGVFFQFTAPILLVVYCMPLCMNQSMALFMRLARHSLHEKVGSAQAVMMNITSTAPLLCPLYQVALYGTSITSSNQPPTNALIGMSTLGMLSLMLSGAAKHHWGD